MIAVISDIHGNLQALEAVLEDAEGHGARSVLCLGDVVGYGGDPNGCVEKVRSAARVTVLGVRRDGELLPLPSDDEVIRHGDHAIVAGPLQAIDELGR